MSRKHIMSWLANAVLLTVLAGCNQQTKVKEEVNAAAPAKAAQSVDTEKPVLPGEQAMNPSQAAEQPLRILRWGPSTTEAGKPFNVQKSGASSFWFEMNKVGKRMSVIVDGHAIEKIAVNQSTRGVSCTVPPELYAAAGKYIVYLQDPDTGEKSQNVTFTVR